MPEFTTHPTTYRITTSEIRDPTTTHCLPASVEYRNV
jgi:hypothetical protein